VLPEIPIYMGTTAKRVLSVIETVKKKMNKGGKPELVDGFKMFEAGKPLTIKDIKITPYTVDHSAFDAYMLLIEAEGKRVLHTGDFRMHGARGRKMPLVFEKYTRDIDALIIEGTMLSRIGEKVMTEHELGAEAEKLLHDNKSVFVLCSSTNIDSIAEFYSAAIASKKPFVVCEDDFQLEILRIVSEVAKSPFYDFCRHKIYTYNPHSPKLREYMRDCGFCMIGRTNYITQTAMTAFPDNLLIYSMFDGYLNEKHVAFDAYKNEWINKAVANGSRLVHLHTSGHATTDDIKRVCEITQAKTIIPIHCEKPEAFRALGINAEIKVLDDGGEVSI